MTTPDRIEAIAEKFFELGAPFSKIFVEGTMNLPPGPARGDLSNRVHLPMIKALRKAAADRAELLADLDEWESLLAP